MTEHAQIFIIKADGNKVPFDIKKLHASLARAGASQETIEYISSHVEKELTDGMLTSEIYRHAFSLLKKNERSLAARYSMKRAVLALGPSGFPFENFVAEIFKSKGFTTLTGVEVQGVCTRHEVDLIARDKEKCIGAELKFHNRLGTKSDLKDALYVSARFKDIITARKKQHDTLCINEGWFITNTKFTKNAIKYGMCSGLTMISWGHPTDGSLADLIRETAVQPVTALTSLSQFEKKYLLENKVVLCKMIHQNTDVLKGAGISDKKIKTVVAESQALCG